jgi:hypothetical protein
VDWLFWPNRFLLWWSVCLSITNKERSTMRWLFQRNESITREKPQRWVDLILYLEEQERQSKEANLRGAPKDPVGGRERSSRT